jgi:hypothetical protein
MGRSEVPIDTGLLSIAALGPSLGFATQGLDIGDSSGKTLLGQDTQLNLGDVESTAMLGRVMDFQPL